jgi:hypothetical protein
VSSRGPVPKREDVRRRRNKDEAGPATRAAAAKHVPVPRADPDWHPIAKRWYASLKESGQSFWYEPSDWAAAVYVAEAMSRNLAANDGKFSAVLFQSVMSAMTELLTTEGARRRARVELEREESAEDASVTAIADYRAMLGGS